MCTLIEYDGNIVFRSLAACNVIAFALHVGTRSVRVLVYSNTLFGTFVCVPRDAKPFYSDIAVSPSHDNVRLFAPHCYSLTNLSVKESIYLCSILRDLYNSTINIHTCV